MAAISGRCRQRAGGFARRVVGQWQHEPTGYRDQSFLQPSVEVLLRRAQNAGTVREDLRATELIALLAAICQEAMTDHWSERFRRRALTILFHGIRPTAAE